MADRGLLIMYTKSLMMILRMIRTKGNDTMDLVAREHQRSRYEEPDEDSCVLEQLRSAGFVNHVEENGRVRNNGDEFKVHSQVQSLLKTVAIVQFIRRSLAILPDPVLYCHACAASALHEHVHNDSAFDMQRDIMVTPRRIEYARQRETELFDSLRDPNQSEARAATESDSNHGGWYNRGSVGAGWQLSIPRFVSRMVKMLEKYISNIFCNLFIGLLGRNVLLNYYYYVPYWHHWHYQSQHEISLSSLITNTITVIYSSKLHHQPTNL